MKLSIKDRIHPLAADQWSPRQVLRKSIFLHIAILLGLFWSGVASAATSAPLQQDLFPAGSDWTTTQGQLETLPVGKALVPGVELKRSVNLQPGLYELQLSGSGKGILNLSGIGQGRTMRTSAEPGIYGLMFEITELADVGFVLKYQGSRADRFVLASTRLVVADADRQSAWDAAKKSYELLGYFGTDPQRPIPGSTKGTTTTATFSPEDLAKSAIRDTIVFRDPAYDATWVEEDGEVADFFSQRGLPVKNAIETEEWLKARAEGDKGVGSSIIFAMGTAPASIVYQPTDDCLLARYLRAGGRVVWMADLPMLTGQGAKGTTFSNTSEPGGSGGAPAETMLGLSRDKSIAYGVSGPTLTAAGKAWGLEPGLSLIRPFHIGGVTVSFVTDPKGQFCGVGLVNFRADVPFSGFVFVPDRVSPEKDSILRNVYRLARYSGSAVAIPEATAPKGEDSPITAGLRFGVEDQRMVYLRGESVPLVLRIRSENPAITKIAVRYSLCEGDAVLRDGTAEISVGADERDEKIGSLDLNNLRVGRYTVTATIDINGKSTQVSRELRIGPAPDHRGTHVAIWCSASPKINRTEDLLDDLEAHNLTPLFADAIPQGRDLALWYGMSFSTRRHGEAKNVPHPPGYNDDRLGSGGQTLKVRAQGDKRVSKGYASPLRRQAEVDDFQRQVSMDATFPAFRQRVVTADDYSQWFGLDYNRYAVEGFKKLYGIDVPKPKGTEDPYNTISIDRTPGIIPDNDAWLLLNRYWSETLGDAGTRFSRAMESVTGGSGKVGPVPGGMQLPVINMGSGQYAPFNFGAKKGFNLSSFYYYNSFWQPLLTHVWWLECARMGNRDIEQWMMPDCYQLHFDSFYRNSFWLMLAGGAHGLPYFRYEERIEEPMAALKDFGALSKRYGLLLADLRPAPKKVAMLVPFENVTYRVENGWGMSYAFANLLLAKVDAEPVSPEELDAHSIRSYEAVVLANTKWLKAGTVRLLEDYIAAGGKVVSDSVTAKAIPIKGAIVLDFPLGEEGVTKYGLAEQIAQVRAAMLPIIKPPVDSDNPFVVVRRTALPDGTPGVWLVDNLNQEEYAKLKAASKSDSDKAKALEQQLGYGRETVSTMITRADDGRIPFDVFAGKVLEATRADGTMSVKVEMPKWQGKLILFLQSVPAQIALDGVPSEVRPGEPVKFEIRLLDAAGVPVTTPWPLRLAVRDPKGQENREYSNRLLTANGSASASITFASNDLRGSWTLEVEDVLTGVKTSKTLLLKP